MKVKGVLFLSLCVFIFSGYVESANSSLLKCDLAGVVLQANLHSGQAITAGSDTVELFRGEHAGMTEDTTAVLNKIVRHTDEIVRYTKPASLFGDINWNDWYALFIAIAAAVISIVACYWTFKGAKWQKDAEENTRSIRQIQKEQQGYLLLDFIRHLYRNKVIICALQWQLDGKYATHYPLDEHILKLKTPVDELELDRFSESSDYFDELHRLKLLCRNMNIEIEMTFEHLKTQDYPSEYKIHDLKTLEFKCQYITDLIIKIMYKLKLLNKKRWKDEIDEIEKNLSAEALDLQSYDNCKAKESGNEIDDDYLQKVRLLLFNRIRKNNKDEDLSFSTYTRDPVYRKEEEKFRRSEYDDRSRRNTRYRYYDDILQLGDQLNYDIYMEGLGKNGGIIKLIQFDGCSRYE